MDCHSIIKRRALTIRHQFTREQKTRIYQKKYFFFPIVLFTQLQRFEAQNCHQSLFFYTFYQVRVHSYETLKTLTSILVSKRLVSLFDGLEKIFVPEHDPVIYDRWKIVFFSFFYLLVFLSKWEVNIADRANNNAGAGEVQIDWKLMPANVGSTLVLVRTSVERDYCDIYCSMFHETWSLNRVKCQLELDTRSWDHGNRICTRIFFHELSSLYFCRSSI